MNNSNLQSSRPSGGTRGKGRGKGRNRGGRNNRSKRLSRNPDPDLAPHTSEPLRDGMFAAEMHDPQPSKLRKKSSQLYKSSESEQKRRKELDGDHDEAEMFRKEITLKADVDKKGREQAYNGYNGNGELCPLFCCMMCLVYSRFSILRELNAAFCQCILAHLKNKTVILILK